MSGSADPADPIPQQPEPRRTRLLLVSLVAHLAVLGLAAIVIEALPGADPGDETQVIAVDLVALAQSASPAQAQAPQEDTPASRPSALPPPAPQAAPVPEPVPEPVAAPEPVPDPVPEPATRPRPAVAPAPAQAVQPASPPSAPASPQPGGQAAGGGTPDTDAGASSGSAAQVSYARLLLARLQRAIIYPRNAQRRGIEGTASVEVVLAADGSLRRVRLSETSGHAVLDDAALALVRRVAPFPPVPEGLAPGGADFAFVAPIQYRLN